MGLNKTVTCSCSMLLLLLIVGCAGGPETTKQSPAPSSTPGGNTPTPGSPSAPGPPNQGNPGTAIPSPPPSSATVNITSPANGATVTTPFQVTAAANGSGPITTMQVYIDNNLAYQTSSNQMNTSVNAGEGQHLLVVQAWDQTGQTYKNSLSITVSAPNGGNPTFSQIQRIPDWSHCSVCAGRGGNGPPTDHWMEEGIGSPSLSGAAARFNVGGTPWGAAIWWKQLGGDTRVSNFRYDLNFYVDRPDLAQALEFDVNQDTGGRRYIYGTECDFGDTKTWRVWNSSSHKWDSTGIYCGRPDAGRWNHVTWELQRNNGQVIFVAVTLNGNRQPVDRSYDSYAEDGEGIDVAFQADLNASGGSLSVWLDNVNLTTW